MAGGPRRQDQDEAILSRVMKVRQLRVECRKVGAVLLWDQSGMSCSKRPEFGETV
jgi:hypothetical protein